MQGEADGFGAAAVEIEIGEFELRHVGDQIKCDRFRAEVNVGYTISFFLAAGYPTFAESGLLHAETCRWVGGLNFPVV